jgi:cysteine desulfuration protein SufE
MKIADIMKEVVEEFESLGDSWEDKYQHVIDLGKTLAPLSETLKTEDKLIRGCQSRVWLHAELVDGRIVYSAESDAVIIKGIVALLLRVLSNQRPEEIVKSDLSFISKIGLKEHLSPTRASGLVSLIRQMKIEAVRLGKLDSDVLGG